MISLYNFSTKYRRNPAHDFYANTPSGKLTKAFKIEETAKDIAKNVEALGRHLKTYEDYYNKIGNSLSTTVNHYNAGRKELGKVDKDVLKITGGSIGLDGPLLEKPTLAGDE